MRGENRSKKVLQALENACIPARDVIYCSMCENILPSMDGVIPPRRRGLLPLRMG